MMQTLVRIALVGTANEAAEAAGVPAINALLPAGSREQRLLWQAGAHAVYCDAGRNLAQIDLPAPAPEESLPETPRLLTSILRAAIGGELGELAEWLVPRIARAGYRLPVALLPAVFDKPTVLAAWQRVIGARGHWLATQNPTWQAQLQKLVAAEPDDAALLRDWEEGSTAQRSNALSMQRLRDPAKGREWLVATLPKEKADQRQALAGQLIHGLCADDETLLENLLDDRSHGVRQTAASLLVHLPASAYMQRMRARADACVRWQPAVAPQGLLTKIASLAGGKTGPTLQVAIPQELPKEWERDGIAANPPAGQGRRAFWLRQLVSLLPPAYWSEQAGADPEVLVPLMEADEWAHAMLAGCAEASCRHADPQWSAVLLDRAIGSSALLRPFHDMLWSLLPPDICNARLCRALQIGHAITALRRLRQMPGPWSGAIIEMISKTMLSDNAGTRTPEELRQHPDLTEIVELAMLRTPDDALATLMPLVDIYAAGLSESTATQSRQFNRARQIVAMAQAKQTVIKEMPL